MFDFKKKRWDDETAVQRLICTMKNGAECVRAQSNEKYRSNSRRRDGQDTNQSARPIQKKK